MKNILLISKKNILVCFIFMIVFFISSCELPELANEKIPYLIKDLSFVLESNQEIFANSGVSFRFCNVSEKEISQVEVAFWVFENEKGGNPFFTTNFVEATFSGSIKSREEKVFEISLDEKMNYQPKEPLYADYFFVKSIKFDDGTEWKDSFGLFAISGVENE